MATNYQDQDTAELDIGMALEAGVELCQEGDWKRGLDILWKIARKPGSRNKLPARFYSYTGLGTAEFHKNLDEGLRLCRYALKLDRASAESYLNLARVYDLRNDRRRTVKALERGLRLKPRDRDLLVFRKEIGYRRPPVIRFLSRDNPLNVWLGKKRYLKELESSGEK